MFTKNKPRGKERRIKMDIKRALEIGDSIYHRGGTFYCRDTSVTLEELFEALYLLNQNCKKVLEEEES
jgi:hypothetical protein